MKKTILPSYAYSWSNIHRAPKHIWEDGSWQRLNVYYNKNGTVVITEYSWRNRQGWQNSTDFETIHKGRHHRMILETNGLGERSLKHYAARFLTSIKKLK